MLWENTSELKWTEDPNAEIVDGTSVDLQQWTKSPSFVSSHNHETIYWFYYRMTPSLYSNYNCWHGLIISDAAILCYSTLSYKMHVQTLCSQEGYQTSHNKGTVLHTRNIISKSLENDVSFTAYALTIKTTLQTKTKLNCLKFVSKSWCLMPVRERIICFTFCHIRYLGRNFICWTFCHLHYLGWSFICLAFRHLHYLVRIFMWHIFFHFEVHLFLWGVTFCHLYNWGGDIIYDIFVGAFFLRIWCGIISYKY